MEGLGEQGRGGGTYLAAHLRVGAEGLDDDRLAEPHMRAELGGHDVVDISGVP